MTTKTLPNPTDELWSSYQVLFNWFNEQLFDNDLPPCVLNFSTKATVYGFFSANRWQKEEDTTAHEISLNPDLLNHPIDEIASTLVRQMVHLWQFQFGMPPSKPGYHNAQWAEKMVSIGLIPSDTGQPDGRQTGFKMGHFIQGNGAFEKALETIKDLKSDYFLWKGTADIKPSQTSRKVKYNCSKCGANVWGAEDLVLTCQTNECDQTMEAAKPHLQVDTVLPFPDNTKQESAPDKCE